MKRALIAAVLFMGVLLPSGCWDQRELDNLALVAGVGIDLNKANTKIILSSQVIIPSKMKMSESGSGSGSGSGSERAGGDGTFLVQSEDTTIFKAIRSSAFQTNRKLNFTHNEVIIFSKRIAERGLSPYVDFFIRNAEPRPTELILVTEGEAKDILEATPHLEKSTALEIKGLMGNWENTSMVDQVILQDLVEKLISKSASATIPVITISGQGNTKGLVLNGLAVFRKDKWAGKMGRRETRGLLWVTDKVKSGIISVPAPGGKIDIEIINTSGKMKPELKPTRIGIDIEIRVEGNIGSQMSGKDMSNRAGIEELEKQVEAEIKSEIMAAVHKAKALKADIFGFGESIYRSYPSEWQAIEPEWEERFPEVVVRVKVKSVIKLIGETTSPL